MPTLPAMPVTPLDFGLDLVQRAELLADEAGPPSSSTWSVESDILRGAQSPWTANDYHDVRFLSVALAYCSAACPDRRWGDLALRSEYIVNRGV